MARKRLAKDRAGKTIRVGARVRVLSLSGRWLDSLADEERARVLSLVGEVLEVEEIDEYGHPWVSKQWPGPDDGHWESHSVALQPNEMEIVE